LVRTSEFAREVGAERIRLHATPVGRPIDERLGFTTGAAELQLILRQPQA
jgi:hypothetical protein